MGNLPRIAKRAGHPWRMSRPGCMEAGRACNSVELGSQLLRCIDAVADIDTVAARGRTQRDVRRAVTFRAVECGGRLVVGDDLIQIVVIDVPSGHVLKPRHGSAARRAGREWDDEVAAPGLAVELAGH